MFLVRGAAALSLELRFRRLAADDTVPTFLRSPRTFNLGTEDGGLVMQSRAPRFSARHLSHSSSLLESFTIIIGGAPSGDPQCFRIVKASSLGRWVSSKRKSGLVESANQRSACSLFWTSCTSAAMPDLLNPSRRRTTSASLSSTRSMRNIYPTPPKQRATEPMSRFSQSDV
jgi:hypothetical protein